MTKGVLQHTLFKYERPYLDRTYLRGETVYRYDGYTFGLCEGCNDPVLLTGRLPFYELPKGYVKWEDE